MDDLDQFILGGNSFSGSAELNAEGNLTRDPHLRYLPNGTAVCDFGLEMQGSQWDPHPYILMQGIVYESFLCKAYGETAEIIYNYYRKGNQINISGFIWGKELISPTSNFQYDKLTIFVSEITLSEIRQVCHEHGINTLCHFTRSERLRSMLHRGLLSRNFLEKLPPQVRPQFPDQNRDDGYKEAICLSISFPNYKMFFSKTGRDNQHKWVVLLLDARVLWELDCAFCHQNAIYEPVLRVSLENRKKLVSLERMFWDSDYHATGVRYQRQQIPDNYPTHPEAEILVFDSIPEEYIKEIHFYNQTALQTWRKDNPENYTQKFYSDQKYFKYRLDYKAWQN